ncbi:protein ACCELERATED CELL DEATH 6 [Ziziphus jujuba]|uniref:Protein ACCELERATED CELL DEATH 6 n=1 Tax=Ziziphus jujuba TaxID=326968 RepID=A0ABM3IHK8_ZIZJJ|nr:protein ACCELERATED CELL DEATH 6 [Ziziphus jujuba]
MAEIFWEFCRLKQEGLNKTSSDKNGGRNDKISAVEEIDAAVGKSPDLGASPDNQGMSALHIVAKQGHVNVMEEIISHNPDACELIDNRGWNPLHVAIANAKLNVVRLILKKLRLDSLINATNRKFMIVKKLDKQGGRASLRSLVNGINIHEVGHENNEIKCHRLKNISNIHLLVASLIATVTFTTGFTMPGGYEQDRSSTKGMAMFCNKTSFKVFVIAYSKAFYCSSA